MNSHHPTGRLSDISHLFLSDVRARHTEGAPLPMRRPPGSFRAEQSVDMTPQEFAEACARPAAVTRDREATTTADRSTDEQLSAGLIAPVTDTPAPFLAGDQLGDEAGNEVFFSPSRPVEAVIAHHLGEEMADAVNRYAAVLSTNGRRTGVIYVDAANVRVSSVEASIETSCEDRLSDEQIDTSVTGLSFEQVVTELHHDVDRWLVVLPDVNLTESRELFKAIDRWTLLTRPDHESVVASYRAIKGLCDIARPSVYVAVDSAEDGCETEKVFEKIASVCRQFLTLEVDLFGGVSPTQSFIEQPLYEPPSNAQARACDELKWQVLNRLAISTSARKVKVSDSAELSTVVAEPPVEVADRTAECLYPLNPKVVVPESWQNDSRADRSSSKKDCASSRETVDNRSGRTAGRETEAQAGERFMVDNTVPQIIDLPAGAVSSTGIISAVIEGGRQWVATPVRPADNEQVTIAVARDGCLTLLAVALTGQTSDWTTIAEAYRWLIQNRALVSMALPQFAIDPHARPRLHVLIDHDGANLKSLPTLLADRDVTLCAYRRVGWGGRTGLLLEAA